jgi:hypothetical protein
MGVFLDQTQDAPQKTNDNDNDYHLQQLLRIFVIA